MQIPVITGIIERRILANYRIDAAVMARQLPAPFRPRLINGYAIGGICLIRLIDVKPQCLPMPFGLNSENAAHRIAVEWDDQGQVRHGVYVPRRDTDSRINAMMGGKMFPGVQHLAAFTTTTTTKDFSVTLTSEDGHTHVQVSGSVAKTLPPTSVFSSLAAASQFFAEGAVGYSPNPNTKQLEGMELRCKQWQVEVLNVDRCESSYFSNPTLFPAGSVVFDCALLMRNIDHEWHQLANLCCDKTPTTV